MPSYDKTGFGNEVLTYFYDTEVNGVSAAAGATIKACHLPNLGKIRILNFGVIYTTATSVIGAGDTAAVFGLYNSAAASTLIGASITLVTAKAVGSHTTSSMDERASIYVPHDYPEINLDGGEYVLLKQITQGVSGGSSVQTYKPFFTYEIVYTNNTTILR